MNIYQTINISDNYKMLEKEISRLSYLNIKGIRFNLCKYNYENIETACSQILSIIKNYKDQYDFLFDLPYPKNKSRIISHNISSELIIGGHEYYIVNRLLKEKKKNNTIMVDIIKFDEKAFETDRIYYGDGEGIFEIEEFFEDRLKVIAVNNFEIHKEKAISCGLNENVELSLKIAKKIIESDSVKKATFLLSFVKNAKEIEIFKNAMQYNDKYNIIAKIEAIGDEESIKKIISASDGALLARGDMALLNPINRVMDICECVSRYTCLEKKRLFLATDILSSLSKNGFPSRADIIDLCFAAKIQCSEVIIPYGYKKKREFIKYIYQFFE